MTYIAGSLGAAMHDLIICNRRGYALKKALFITVGLILTASPLWADMFLPSHHCFQPSKPYSFNSQWEVDKFNDDVRQYKACIEEFVEEQNAAINNHREAADDAIDEWNNFVNWELNR